MGLSSVTISLPNVCADQGIWGFPGGSDDKESACNVGDLGLIPRLGGSPGEGKDNPLWYSCLGNLMDRGVRRATVHGIRESDMTGRLTLLTFLTLDCIQKECPKRYFKGECMVITHGL